MTTDGSTGRRGGFERWVASMKSEHQPLEAKPAALKPAVPKLELELDDNATHVHRIPKELIHRMREQPPPQPPIPREEEDDDEPRSGLSSLGVVQEDRTAVFRPPPELLARAKRMKAPPKPDAQASVPTKPPPASQAELLQSMPAAPKVPGFESVPAAAKGGFASVPLKSPLTASARAPLPAVARASAPAASSAAAVEAPPASAKVAHFAEPLVETAVAVAAPPASVPEPPDSSAVFARREPGSGVLPVDASQKSPVPAADDGDEPDTREYRVPDLGVEDPAFAGVLEEPTTIVKPALATAEPDSPFAFEPSSVVPIVPPEVEVAGPVPSTPVAENEEPEAPTTHAPVVRAEPSVAPEPPSSFALRALLFVVVVLATAAVAWWRVRHH